MPALHQLGIVGSGQIARMTHQAALQLGITPRLLAENASDSAAQAAPQASFSHPDTLYSFASDCEVITFEHERIDIGLLAALEREHVAIRPGVKTIRAAFDRLHQRRALSNKGFLVPLYAELRSPDDVIDFAEKAGYPFMIKTIRSGAPGQLNVWRVENSNEALRVLAENPNRELMAEEHLDILSELVVLVVRRPGGNMRTYPVAEAVNANGACHIVRVPASIGNRVAAESVELAQRIATELETVGVLAVEIFITTKGVVVNELAARPHNAGHPTIEGAVTSQFENHVRAILDLPLGLTTLRAPAVVSINIIGRIDGFDPARNLPDALAVEGANVHLYGKRPWQGRKLGHVTALGDSFEQALALAQRAESALRGRHR